MQAWMQVFSNHRDRPLAHFYPDLLWLEEVASPRLENCEGSTRYCGKSRKPRLDIRLLPNVPPLNRLSILFTQSGLSRAYGRLVFGSDHQQVHAFPWYRKHVIRLFAEVL